MLTDFTWKAFESTGSIESYMLFRELHNYSKNGNKQESSLDEVAISTDKEL